MKIDLRPATLDDCDVLGVMNAELIQDEGSRNPMSPIELAERMRGWLSKDWQAVLVLTGKVVIGYALFQQRRDDYHPEQVEVYIRQYFIKRVFRGKGIGQMAFTRLQTDYFPPGATLALDVLAANPGARRFWEKMGFQSYAENLRLEKRSHST